MNYVFWLVLMFGGHGMTTIPVPYSTLEECEKAAQEYKKRGGFYTQYGNCISQPAYDVNTSNNKEE